jgi:hypothetical protein|tara:strand:- start:4199 stop:5047 length:849 start_codon:yes stop_codon:yes gene_type:complete
MEKKNTKIQVKAKSKANSKAKPKKKPNLKQKVKSINNLLKKQRGGSNTINLFMTKSLMNWTPKLEKIINILFESLKDNNKYKEKIDELEELADEYQKKIDIIDKSEVFFILNYINKPTPLTLLQHDPALIRVDYVYDETDIPDFRIVEKYVILLDRNREIIEEYYKIKENLRDIQKEITIIEKEIIKKIKRKRIMIPKITDEELKKELMNLLNRINFELRKLEEWKEYFNEKNDNDYDLSKDLNRMIKRDKVLSDDINIKYKIYEKLDILNTKKELYELLYI